jgi:RNA polymerase sigma factor (sigma-70 family)
MSWQNKKTLVNGGNGMALALELDNFSGLLVIQQLMKRFFSNDSDLLKSVIAGDVAAWQKFILDYSNFIYRAIIKYTDDYDEKMAVYLHILEKLHENRFERLSRFSFQAKLSTWLTVVARRLALDFLRSKYGRDFRLKKIKVVSFDAEPDYLKQLADTLTPEHELAHEEKQQGRERLEQTLYAALQGLSDQESLAVQLVYFKGLKIREVGKLLKLPSAYKFVARTLQKIKAEMESRPRFSRAGVQDALEGEAHE